MHQFQDPWDHFKAWYEGANDGFFVKLYKGFHKIQWWFLSQLDPSLQRIEENAFVLSTASKDLNISSRVVLLKSYNQNGLYFYTNYNSHKGAQIQSNPQVSALFYSLFPLRQIRIEGQVEKAPLEDSEEYWNSRPRMSQLSAMASAQSTEIKSKDELVKKIDELNQHYKDKKIPRPENWGGYIIKPQYFEFWQGRASRLHDRIAYKKTPSGWQKSLLSP